MLVNSLNEISLETFKEAAYTAVTNKITSVAPLGYSSPTILLYGNDGNERRCGVSIRNHSGTLSLLICNSTGSFLFHGGFDKRLPVDFIASECFRTFKKVRKYIEKELPKKDEIYSVNCNHTSGLDILASLQRSLLNCC